MTTDNEAFNEHTGAAGDAARSEEQIEEAGLESFPASDPPSFTPQGVGARGDLPAACGVAPSCAAGLLLLAGC